MAISLSRNGEGRDVGQVSESRRNRRRLEGHGGAQYDSADIRLVGGHSHASQLAPGSAYGSAVMSWHLFISGKRLTLCRSVLSSQPQSQQHLHLTSCVCGREEFLLIRVINNHH